MESEYDKKRALNFGTTPKQDLSIRKELDDVALKTINEIAYVKANKLNEELDDVERIKWYVDLCNSQSLVCGGGGCPN